jgi:selenocysteine lyase/cysteine desulfurase
LLPIETIRRDTALSNEIIHFNNAGGSLCPKIVTEKMSGYLTEEGRLGGYEIALDRKEELDGFYHGLATYLNTKAGNIALAKSATDAFNRGLSAIRWKADDIVLTTKSDYVSNHILFLQLEHFYGVTTEILPEGKTGYDPEGLRERLRKGPRPKLVSITHIPTNSGRVQDIHAAGELCREYELLYAVDACQSAGQLPVDVQAIGCDFLSATFRKYLRGPRGIAFLYVSDRVLTDPELEPLGLDLRGAEWTAPNRYQPMPDARRFESWERSMVLQLGAATAIDYLNQLPINEVRDRIIRLADRLSRACAPLAFLKEHRYFESPEYGHQSGILLFDVDTPLTAAELIAALRREGLHASTSGVGNDQHHFREQQIDWALRLSIHYYNTEEEIAQSVNILRKVLG